MEQKSLFFGGTFDPVHLGHLISSRVSAEYLGLKKVVLIPTVNPPWKKETAAPYTDREIMCRFAVQGDPFFEVKGDESNPDGYTITTVKNLIKQGYQDIHWMVGVDCLYDFHKWHQWQELLDLITLVVVPRGLEINWAKMDQKLVSTIHDYVVSGVQKLKITPANFINISSTEIRERITQGKSIRYLVPNRGIEEYIAIKKLYGKV